MSYAEPRTALRPLLPSGPGGLGCCHPDPSWALILSKDRALWPFFNHVVCVLRVETFFFFCVVGLYQPGKYSSGTISHTSCEGQTPHR